MGILDWIVLGAIAIACVLSIVYIVRHKNKCIGCGGDCSKCAHCKKD